MDAAYAFVFASLLTERLFDPLTVTLSIAAGLICRRWPALVVMAAGIAAIAETARHVSNFQPGLLAVGWGCALAWGSLAYALKKRWTSP